MEECRGKHLELLDDRLAKSTKKAYATHYGRWINWCANLDADPLAPSLPVLTYFLEHMAFQKKSAQIVRASHAAIIEGCIVAGVPRPITDESFKKAMDSIRKKYAAKPKQKRPMTIDIIRKLVDMFLLKDLMNLTTTNLVHWRTIVRLMVSYFAPLRNSEARVLAKKDFDFKESDKYMVVTIKDSKTDQLGVRGHHVNRHEGQGRRLRPALHPQPVLQVHGRGDRAAGWQDRQVHR